MSPVAPESLLESLQWRYATKKFDSEYQIPADLREALLQSLRLTPSSFGLQPWKFVVVENPALRQSLRPASHNQDQIVEASLLLVLCRPEEFGKEDVRRYVRSVAQTRRQPLDALLAYQQMMEAYVLHLTPEARAAWMEKQVYIALGNLLTSSALLGLDACPIEGISRDEYDRILGLPERGLRTLVVCALGRRASDDRYATAAKVRYTPEDLFITL